MKRWLFDTSALLALRDDEAGAEEVANLLVQAQNGKARCFACFITLMEMLYRVWKDEGEAEGKLAYAQCLALPIEWLHETPELLQAAARLKATQKLSLADAWIAAAAELKAATLVHKDPEFVALSVAQLRLPFKARAA
jgi:predicted nucleic acid-binding protein